MLATSQGLEQLRTAQEPPVLELTLTDDRWSEALVEEVQRQGLTQGGAQVEHVLSSFRSPSSQQDGWNAVMHSGPQSDNWGYGPSQSCNGCDNIWNFNSGHANPVYS